MSDGKPRYQILVCDGPSCGLCHSSEELRDHMQARVDARDDLRARVDITQLTCFGRCDEGPNLLVRELAEGEDGSVEPDIEALEGTVGLYLENTTKRVDRILDEHVGQGRPIDDWVESYD